MKSAAYLAFLLIGLPAQGGAEPLPCGADIATTTGERDGASLARLGGSGHLVTWRDNRGADGGQTYLTFVDSLGRLGVGWPSGGVQVGTTGRRTTPPLIAALGPRSAVIAWSAFVDSEVGTETLGAIVSGSDTGPLAPTDVLADTVTNLPGSQVPVAVVPLGERNGLIVIQSRDLAGKAQVLMKSVGLPGGGGGTWPTAGVILAEESNVFPFGLAAVSACTDDSSGCLVLAAGTVPIDLFHQRITYFLFRLLPDGSRDPRWPPAGRVLTTDGDEFNLRNEILPDGKGGAYVAWTTGNHGPAGRVRVMVQRVDRDGKVHSGWGPEAVVAIPSDVALYQWYPRLSGDGRERVAVLLATDDGASRLRAIAGDGSTYVGWPDTGLVIGDVFGHPLDGSARVLGTDSSVIVATWAEARAAPNAPLAVFATSVDWAGELLSGWPASGKPLCATSRNQKLEALTSATGDTFAIVWIRGPNGLRFGRFDIRDGALPVGAQARHTGYSVEKGFVTTHWTGSAPMGSCLYGLRRVDLGAWVVVDSVQRIGADEFVLTDPWPAVMNTVEYRLGVAVEGQVQGISDTLSLGAVHAGGGLRLAMSRVQSGRSLWMFLTVGALEAEAELRAFDVNGRCIASRKLGRLSRGTHLVELDLPRARPGIVFVRATCPSSSSVARATLLN
jgi:hypothetical protein